VLASPQPLVEYAFFPAMKSCQTKMLLGFWCARDVEVTSAMVQEAKRRLLEEVVFFGLTEEWEATTQLFHKMLGGAMHHCDRHAARTSRATDTTVRRSYDLLLSRGYRDEPDEQVRRARGPPAGDARTAEESPNLGRASSCMLSPPSCFGSAVRSTASR